MVSNLEGSHDLNVEEHFINGMGCWVVVWHFDEDVLSRSTFKRKKGSSPMK